MWVIFDVRRGLRIRNGSLRGPTRPESLGNNEQEEHSPGEIAATRIESRGILPGRSNGRKAYRILDPIRNEIKAKRLRLT